jgi:hypothetical protein
MTTEKKADQQTPLCITVRELRVEWMFPIDIEERAL